MEVEKRKRVVVVEEEEERESLKKLKGEEDGESGEGVVVPTEDEVDEFFAILRRMRVAVKYFDEKEKGRDGKAWREALEQVDVMVADGVDADEVAAVVEKKEEKAVNEVLDLNAVAPEAAESGGA